MPLDLITTAQVAAGKPMDTTLWGKVKDALDKLDAFIKTATGHTHDQGGTDQGGPVTPADGSVTTAKIAAANVTLAKLKFTQGSYTLNGPWSGNIYVSMANDYAHYPKLYGTNNSSPIDFSCGYNGLTPNGQYFHLSGTAIDGTVTVSWQQHAN